MEKQILILNEQIDSLIHYIKLKIQLRDWHAVSDAAMDIRELEAKISVLKNLDNP